MNVGRKRHSAVILLSMITVIGFSTKWYSGPAAKWVNESLGGVFYEVFWCLLVSLLRPRIKPSVIAGSVLAVTCFLEFIQLWKHPVLEWIRGYFIGSALIGTTFVWSDFPYYFLGCGLGWLLIIRFRLNAKIPSDQKHHKINLYSTGRGSTPGALYTPA